MAAGAQQQQPAVFDPAAFQSFRFLDRRLDPDGTVALVYALGGELRFTERVALPVATPLSEEQVRDAQGLLALLHWTAGVSYFKAALPGTIECESVAPGPAAAILLEALYSEGLGELAYRNGLEELPRPSFPRAEGSAAAAPGAPIAEPRRILVPVG